MHWPAYLSRASFVRDGSLSHRRGMPCPTGGGHDLIGGRLAQPMADDVPLPMEGAI